MKKENLMRAVVCTRYGNTRDVVEVRELPVPAVAPNDVLIEVHAAALNPVDFKMQQGALKAAFRPKLPYIMGLDVSGTVVEIGEKTRGFKKGDEVFSKVGIDRLGTFAEYIATDERYVARKPANITHEEAASFPLVAQTTWQSLFEVADLRAGQKVFIPAGSGGIGAVAIQIAKNAGAEVATTTSTVNVEMVKKLGADIVIDYKQQDFTEILKGYDVVYETMGGEHQRRSFGILKPGGILVSIVGIPNAAWAREMGLPFFMPWAFHFLNSKNRRLAKRYGARFDVVMLRPDGKRLEKIAAQILAGELKPVIDRCYSLDQAQEALLHSQSGRAKGKIILKVK